MHAPIHTAHIPARRTRLLRAIASLSIVVAMLALNGASHNPSPVVAQGIGPWTHTSVADFSGCSQTTDTFIANVDGGEVRLAAAVEDYFDGPNVDETKWYSDTYSGQSTSPYQSGGVLTVNSSAVVSLFTDDSPYLDVEGRVQFGPDGLTGVADFGLAYPYQVNYLVNALFITDENGYLHANNLREGLGLPNQRTQITGVDLTQYHDYRIEVAPAEVNFYIDGALRVTHPQTTPLTFNPMGLWILTQGIDRPFNAEWARWNQYPAGGTFVSCPIDAGQIVNWQTLTQTRQTPDDTSVTVETRSSDDLASWSAWSSPDSSASSAIDSPAGRYLQYRLTLTTSDALRSPQIDAVTATGSIGPVTDTPTPSLTPTPSDTPTASNTPTPSNTPTDTATATPTASNTPSPTPSNTATNTPSPTPSNSATSTPTSTNTPSPSNTPAATTTETPTASNTPSPTPSDTATLQPSPTNTATPTQTATGTSTHTPSPTTTATSSPTGTATPTPQLDERIYLPVVLRGADSPLQQLAFRAAALVRSHLSSPD